MRQALILSVVMLTASASFANPISYATGTLNYNIVEFSESAVMEVPRDTMTVYFSVEAEGKNREAVTQAFIKKYNALNARIQANSAFKMETLGRQVYPRYQWGGGKSSQVGWEESARLKVESQDFEALNRLIAESYEDAHLQHTVFSVSKARREAVIDQISETAILRFKQRADSLAKTLQSSGYKIVKLQIGHLGDQSYRYDSAVSEAMTLQSAAASNKAAIAAPEPGTEEIRVTINGAVQM